MANSTKYAFPLRTFTMVCRRQRNTAQEPPPCSQMRRMGQLCEDALSVLPYDCKDSLWHHTWLCSLVSNGLRRVTISSSLGSCLCEPIGRLMCTNQSGNGLHGATSVSHYTHLERRGHIYTYTIRIQGLRPGLLTV